jgi:hypothetical protein
MPWYSATLPPASISVLEKLASVSVVTKTKQMLDVSPEHVHVVASQIGNVAPDPTTVFQLGDSVVVVRAGVAVPPGLFGRLQFLLM